MLISSQKAVPPVRSTDQTLIEYTLAPASITFTSPVNQSQSVSFINSSPPTATTCSHMATPIYVVTHNLGINPDNLNSLFTSYYSLNSYQSSSSVVMAYGNAGKATFSRIIATGTEFKDGPCFLADVALGSAIVNTEFYTLANNPSGKPAPILESRIRLGNVYVTSYRLFSSPGMPLQQEITFSPFGSIYWGYYAYDAEKGTNSPVVEKGWNITNNSPLL